MENMALVTVSLFQNGTPDKNKLQPVILNPVAGRIPAKRVLAGTIAKNLGLVIGETYLITWLITGQDEYGEKVSYTNLGQVPFDKLVEISEKLGKAQVINTKVTVNELPADL